MVTPHKLHRVIEFIWRLLVLAVLIIATMELHTANQRLGQLQRGQQFSTDRIEGSIEGIESKLEDLELLLTK